MFSHDTRKENAYQISRFDIAHPLSSCSPHSIILDGETWPTCEHYYNAQLSARQAHFESVRAAPTGMAAYRIMKPWYRVKQKGWRDKRRVLMSRALYTKVQMYPEVHETLMATADELILETSAYDHFWGLGRDQRGQNTFGRIWMDIRTKLRSASEES